jgi:hypothetical protein
VDADEPDLADAEPVDSPTALTRFRDPGVPVTIDDLASLRGGAIEVLDARIVILETARKRGIRMTVPEDWVLFKSPDGRVTGYLQDCGCERARDVLSVEVFNVREPQKIMAADGQSFVYVQRADGRSRLTLQVVENMEGGRSSTEEFCKGATGAVLELLVRKAARANLDGNVARELMGLKNVPLADLVAAWEGTTKSADNCRRGRGFGTQDERLGGTNAAEPDVEPPTCPHCAPVNGSPVRLKYRPAKGNRAAFYGCPNFEKHPQQKVIIDAAKWAADHKKPAGTTAEENNKLDAELAAKEGTR